MFMAAAMQAFVHHPVRALLSAVHVVRIFQFHDAGLLADLLDCSCMNQKAIR